MLFYGKKVDFFTSSPHVDFMFLEKISKNVIENYAFRAIRK